MRVVVNGENREVVEVGNLVELLKEMELPTERIAVELNKEVVRKKNWTETKINDGDKIEIIHFVGGG
jgi:thiamine biosynthesis protein ThiS